MFKWFTEHKKCLSEREPGEEGSSSPKLRAPFLISSSSQKKEK
jgi:hypothetical protein